MTQFVVQISISFSCSKVLVLLNNLGSLEQVVSNRCGKLYNKKGTEDMGPDVETDMEPDDSEDD